MSTNIYKDIHNCDKILNIHLFLCDPHQESLIKQRMCQIYSYQYNKNKQQFLHF